MRLSAAVITYNEEENLPRLLDAVADFCDEVVIVDSFSDDRTTQIASQNPKVKLYQNAFEGYGAQKNFALSKCSGEWILFLDADEIPDHAAVQEIKTIVNGKANSDVYSFKFNNIFLGKTLQHGEWSNVWRERLFRKNAAKFSDDIVHERFIFTGQSTKLEGRINHFTYRNIEHHLSKSNRYTTMMAEKMQRNGKKFSPAKIILSPIFQFIKTYFVKGGLLDGIPGFYSAVTAAFYTFSKYMKLYELNQKK